jgi:HlyD family secretion protein
MNATALAADRSPTLHDIETTPPTRALAATLWTLVALVTVLLVWALVARLDIVATAPGKLVPASQVKVIQASEAGIVHEIAVRDGDRVKAGQLLLRLDATLNGADSASIDRELALKRITVAAIDATLADKVPRPAKGDPPTLFAQVSQQFAARRLALADAIAQEQQASHRATNERHAALQVRDKLEHTLPVVSQAADSYAKLHQEGFVGELLANEKRKDLIEREQDLKAQHATVQALDAAIAQANQRIVQ